MSGSEYVEKKSSSVPNQTHSSLPPQRLKLPVQPQSDPQEQGVSEKRCGEDDSG